MTSESFSTTWPNLFSNSFAVVGEFQRLLQSFVSIRFSQRARTFTQIPNTSSSARSRSPPSPTQVFLTKKVFTKHFSFSQLLSQNLATRFWYQLPTYCFRAEIRRPRKHKNRGCDCKVLSCQKSMYGRWKGARACAG